MNRRIVPILSTFLFILVLSLGADAIMYNVTVTESMGFDTLFSMPLNVYPPSPQSYPVSDIWFNITQIVASQDTIWINHNFSKSFVDYFMLNDSVNNFYYLLDFVPAAGTYQYKFYANNTTGTYVTNNFTYIIEKATSYINLTLNDEENNRTYGINQTANFSASLPITNETIYLESNYPGWTNQSSNDSSVSYSINLTTVGTYGVTTYWNGSENYTSSSKTYYFTVANAGWSDNQTDPVSGLNYTKDQTYTFRIKGIGAISDVVFEADINNSLVNYSLSEINITNWNITKYVDNDTDGNYWINFTDLGGDSYNYRWIIVDNNSLEVSTDSLVYLINSIVPSVTLGLDTEIATPSSNVVATCSVIPASNITLYITGSGLSGCSGNNSVSCSFTAPSNTGTFTYYCYNAGNENYSITTDSENLVVGTFDGGDSLGGGSSDTTTGQFTIKSSDSEITIDAGTSKVVTFTLSNTLDNDINVTSVTVSGISDEWYALDKTSISRLRDGTTEKVRLTLNIPVDATADNYTIKVKASSENLFDGSTLTREATVKLIVNSDVVPANETVEATALTTDGSQELSDEGNQTTDWILPTALFSMSSEYFPYMVLLLAIAVSIIIFMKRDVLTSNFMKIGGVKKTKKTNKSKLDPFKSIFPRKRQKIEDTKVLEMEEEKAEDLKMEIKKDMKELQNILEAEKKIKKKRK